ncbi:MAG: hypothetical protein LC624_10260, partial [Halobacteriales archaeon]|nr:hypothetical protein [Halobacteriales archaeon]
TERAWSPSEGARRHAQEFAAATERFLGLWEHLLRIQPATEPMRHVLGLVHQGCYELFLSGPVDLMRSCDAIVRGEAAARLDFAPSAPSLRQATHELRQLRA